MHPYIYLASQSPRRQELLNQIGVTFELLLADASEDAESLEAHIPGEAALYYVQRVTLAKLQAAYQRLQKRHLPWAPIVCADTTVAITVADQEMILGKPADEADAKRILQTLSGKTHQVHTAIALLATELAEPKMLVSSSNVTFRTLDDAEMNAYIATGEPMGKAGAYGIQGVAGTLISHISGSFSSIMGLPLCETAQLLQETGIKFSLQH
jgi:septum formation protein